MSLAAALRTLRAPLSLDALLRIVAYIKYTGEITIHFRDGHPRRIACGKPEQFDLCARSTLDTPTDRADSVNTRA